AASGLIAMLTAKSSIEIRTLPSIPLPLRGEGLGVGGPRVRDPRNRSRRGSTFIKTFTNLPSGFAPPPTPPRQGEGGSGDARIMDRQDQFPLPARGERVRVRGGRVVSVCFHVTPRPSLSSCLPSARGS